VNLVNPHDVMFFDTDLPGQVEQGKKAGVKIAGAPRHKKYQTTHDVPLPENWGQPLDEPGRPVAHSNFIKFHDMMLGRIPPDDEQRWTRYQDYYFNCLQDVDVHLGRILDELEVLDLMDIIIVFYRADHGEMVSARGLRGKGSFASQEQKNVPLIMAHPDFKNEARFKALTSHIDLILMMIGVTHLLAVEKAKISEGLPGHYLMPLFEDPESAAYDAVRPAALFAYNMLVYLNP
jgi:arylsulfatase